MIDNTNGGVKIPPRQIPSNMTFGGLFFDGVDGPVYPKWLYREGKDPKKARDAAEEKDLRAKGWDNVSAGMMSNRVLTNHFWDLEDMSTRQLVVYAQDEFGVDLPEEAGQEKLFECVTKLSRAAPQNQNRLVLMAHTMKLNYDETVDEIRRTIGKTGEGYEAETITQEIWA